MDGTPVGPRTAGESFPLVHGSFLQVGDALLRLQLFSALDHTNRPVVPVQQAPAVPAAYGPVPSVPGFMPPEGPGGPAPVPPYPPYSVPMPPGQPEQPEGVPAELPETEHSPAVQEPSPEAPAAAPRRRRSDRWKEDWSE